MVSVLMTISQQVVVYKQDIIMQQILGRRKLFSQFVAQEILQICLVFKGLQRVTVL